MLGYLSTKYVRRTYCHKIGTRLPSCNTPREPTIDVYLETYIRIYISLTRIKIRRFVANFLFIIFQKFKINCCSENNFEIIFFRNSCLIWIFGYSLRTCLWQPYFTMIKFFIRLTPRQDKKWQNWDLSWGRDRQLFGKEKIMRWSIERKNRLPKLFRINLVEVLYLLIGPSTKPKAQNWYL